MLQARYIFRMQSSVAVTFRRTFLSQEYKTTMEKPFVNLKNVERNSKKRFSENGNFIPFEIDTFVSEQPSNDERKEEIYDRLIKIRLSECTTMAPETLNHSIIKYLISVDIDDLLSILSNKMQYGIFLDIFSGCYLMDSLLENGSVTGAAQIAVELMLQEDFENEMVQAFALKSCYEYVKDTVNKKSALTKNNAGEEINEKSNKPIKVRVKFLRNPPDKELINTGNLDLKLVGKTFSIFSKNCANNDLERNGKLLAYLLELNLEDAAKELANNTNHYCKDIIQLCIKALEKYENANDDVLRSIKSSLEKLQSSSHGNYLEAVEEFVIETVAKNEVQLLTVQKDNYEKWIKERETCLNDAIRNQNRLLNKKEIEETVADIRSRKQHLWFFEHQDKLDLDIFQKQVHYPKRWFGKKKTPRAIDDNYIPPEI